MLPFDQLSFWEKRAVTESIDFLIVGAGLVGISTALSLREKYPKAKIVILERGYLSTGASTKNAGFACFGSATELVDDLSRMSETAVWDTVDLRFRGLRKLLERFSPEQLGYIQSGSWDLIMENQNEALQKTTSALPYLNENIQRITGSSNCFSYDSHLAGKRNFAQISGGFHNALEGEIRTNKLLLSCNQLLAENNILPLYGISVNKLVPSLHSVEVETNFGQLTASKAIVTVNGFAQELLGDDRIKPARAQVLVTSEIEGLNLPGTYHYDAGYYYFRSIDNRILLGGGRNLDFSGETTTEFGNTDQIMNSLTTLLKEVIVPGKSFNVDYQWSGIMGVGSEKKPIIEKIHPNVAIGVRMGGMGVAIGSVVGEEVAKLF